MPDVREWSNRLYDLVDQGALDPMMALDMCIRYMSEDDVSDMMRVNDLKQYFEDEDADEDDAE